jgi:branched-chain amino acid transport system permease protein
MIALLINGLVVGSTYAMLAVGFSLIFGVAKILNLSHTGFYMLTSFLLFTATKRLGIPFLPSFFIAVLVTVVLGMVCYRLFFDRIKEHETTVMIISVALVILFQEVLLLLFGGDYVGIPPFISGFLEIGGTRVSYQHLFVIGGSALTLGATWMLLLKTKLGIAIRAVAEDSQIANVMGINVSYIQMAVMGISVSLAGVAAALVAPVLTIYPLMWMEPLTIVLSAVVLGGLGSILGSIIAAIGLGFAESAVIFFIPGGSFLRGAVSLSIMVVVLMIRPEGLFGVSFEEERL